MRYRSEEERLADQLLQTQTKLRMAIEQGQKLRAKTNRYEDELKTWVIFDYTSAFVCMVSIYYGSVGAHHPV